MILKTSETSVVTELGGPYCMYAVVASLAHFWIHLKVLVMTKKILHEPRYLKFWFAQYALVKWSRASEQGVAWQIGKPSILGHSLLKPPPSTGIILQNIQN